MVWYDMLKTGIEKGIYSDPQLNSLKDTGLTALVASGYITESEKLDLITLINLKLGL